MEQGEEAGCKEITRRVLIALLMVVIAMVGLSALLEPGRRVQESPQSPRDTLVRTYDAPTPAAPPSPAPVTIAPLQFSGDIATLASRYKRGLAQAAFLVLAIAILAAAFHIATNWESTVATLADWSEALRALFPPPPPSTLTFGAPQPTLVEQAPLTTTQHIAQIAGIAAVSSAATLSFIGALLAAMAMYRAMPPERQLWLLGEYRIVERVLGVAKSVVQRGLWWSAGAMGVLCGVSVATMFLVEHAPLAGLIAAAIGGISLADRRLRGGGGTGKERVTEKPTPIVGQRGDADPLRVPVEQDRAQSTDARAQEDPRKIREVNHSPPSE